MAAIAYWCVTRHVPAIQHQIKLNADEAVSSVAARDVITSVQGRTVTLNGSVANETQKAELLSAVSAADGARQINDQLSVADTTVAAALPATESTEQSSSLAATTETINTNTQAATPSSQTPESATPIAQTAVTPTPEAPSPEAPTPEAPSQEALSPEAPTPEAPSQEALSPEVPSPEAPTPPEPPSPESTVSPSPAAPAPQAPAPVAPSPADPSSSIATVMESDENTEELVGELAELSLESELDPSSPEETEDTSPVFVDALEGDSSSFSMQIKDGTLTLTGEISTEDDSLGFIQSAMRTFDVNYVVNSMQVSEDSVKASWLPALTEFIPNMQPISDARIEIFESQVTLFGTAPSRKVHDEVVDEALSLLSELSLVDSIVDSAQNSTAPASAAAAELAPTTEPASPEAPTTSQATPAAATQETQNSAQAASPTAGDSTATTPEQLSTLREAFKALEAERILFRSGSDVLTEQSVQTVAAMSALLSKYPDVNIKIDGHTDSLGSSESNLELSQLRANAVRDLMIERGIARERLSAYGFGDGIPIADNGTAEGRKLNRRIEFNF